MVFAGDIGSNGGADWFDDIPNTAEQKGVEMSKKTKEQLALEYPQLTASIELCEEYLSRICKGIPPPLHIPHQQEDYDMQFAAAFDELKEYRKAGVVDEINFRFFYCESEDSYLLGYRVDNFYYARWHEPIGFMWEMSRYLPWDETVESPDSLWKVHTYPSKPKEISVNEWFKGFLKQRLSEYVRSEISIHAHWKLMGMDYVCSSCDEEAEYTYKYCPNCGAKMEG